MDHSFEAWCFRKLNKSMGEHLKLTFRIIIRGPILTPTKVDASTDQLQVVTRHGASVSSFQTLVLTVILEFDVYIHMHTAQFGCSSLQSWGVCMTNQ